jgi:hypothetical protein
MVQVFIALACLAVAFGGTKFVKSLDNSVRSRGDTIQKFILWTFAIAGTAFVAWIAWGVWEASQ